MRLPLDLSRSNVFEPVRPAVFLLQPWFPSIKLSRFATAAFRTVRAVEVWHVVIADVLEPVTENKISSILLLSIEKIVEAGSWG